MLNTEQPADSVEFVGNIALVGTYELRTETNTKHGSVRRYDSTTGSLIDVHRMPSAVLDLKVTDDQRTVACALSDGSVALLDSSDMSSRGSLLSRDNASVVSLALAVEWNDRKAATSGRQLCVSYSDGCVALFDDESRCVERWKAHAAEAWTVAFDCWQPAVVMTGADDSCFKVWDTRAGLHQSSGVVRYEMGVTALQSHTHREHIVAVGSYDESVTVFDLRAVHKPLATHRSGGGVWRLKWQPGGSDFLLAACMHAGFRVLQFDAARGELESVEEWFAPHTSMAYGADWRRDGATIGSCSFYDCLFTLRPFRPPTAAAPSAPSV
jgi:diphthine methyl ester acylhydrolase